MSVATLTRSGSESHQAGQCVGNTQQRRQGQIRDIAVHHRRHGTASEGGTNKIMAIVIGAAQRNEQVTGGEAACIDRYVLRGPIRDARAACRRSSIFGGPERRHQWICQVWADGPNGAISRTIATSSKGWVSEPMIWPVSCPLPAMTRRSPGRVSAIATSIARWRLAISMAPGAAASIARLISAGASFLGLSSVT